MKRLAVIGCKLLLLVSSSAVADPEKSYRGGKSLSDSITGNDTLHTDDRDFQQRMNDWLKLKGADLAKPKNKEKRDDKKPR